MLEKKSIAIFVASEHIGFFISLGNELVINYGAEVTLLGRDSDVCSLLTASSFKSTKVSVMNINEYGGDVYTPMAPSEGNFQEIRKRAAEVEQKYGCCFASLISEDRGLGQGYLFNVAKVPDISRSSWNSRDKLSVILKQFVFAERILSEFDLVIDRWPDKIRSYVCEIRRIQYVCLVSVRFRDYKIWSDNNHITSSILEKHLRECPNNLEYENHDYTPDLHTLKSNSLEMFKLKNVTKEVIKNGLRECWSVWKGTRKKNSYNFCAWIPSIVRRYLNFRYYQRNAVSLDDLRESYDNNYVFMTLHMEPEVSTLSFSVEFTNCLESIAVISKNLPANQCLAVKEHPHSLGVRARFFYETLLKIHNVIFLDLESDTSDVIANSFAVATITGTVGVEGVLQNKPVLSFGKHQLINYLDSVFYVSNYDDVRNAIKWINNLDTERLSVNSERLKHVLLENSFDLPNFADNTSRHSIQEENARIAAEELEKFLDVSSVN